MANDPTDTTKYPLGTNDLYVAARNASDFDKGLNAGNTTFVNRFGKVLPTFEKAIGDAKENYGGLNNRGDWVTLRAYAVNDLWQSTVDDTWYLVLTAYTSGVDEAADIASGNVQVFQGIARQDAVIKIASVFDIDDFARLEEGDAVELIGYHQDTTVGGGRGVGAIARHNGGAAISKTRTRPTDWTDQAQLTAWFADSGADELCLVATDINGSIDASRFGAFDDAYTDKSNDDDALWVINTSANDSSHSLTAALALGASQNIETTTSGDLYLRSQPVFPAKFHLNQKSGKLVLHNEQCTLFISGKHNWRWSGLNVDGNILAWNSIVTSTVSITGCGSFTIDSGWRVVRGCESGLSISQISGLVSTKSFIGDGTAYKTGLDSHPNGFYAYGNGLSIISAKDLTIGSITAIDTYGVAGINLEGPIMENISFGVLRIIGTTGNASGFKCYQSGADQGANNIYVEHIDVSLTSQDNSVTKEPAIWLQGVGNIKINSFHVHDCEYGGSVIINTGNIVDINQGSFTGCKEARFVLNSCLLPTFSKITYDCPNDSTLTSPPIYLETNADAKSIGNFANVFTIKNCNTRPFEIVARSPLNLTGCTLIDVMKTTTAPGYMFFAPATGFKNCILGGNILKDTIGTWSGRMTAMYDLSGAGQTDVQILPDSLVLADVTGFNLFDVSANGTFIQSELEVKGSAPTTGYNFAGRRMKLTNGDTVRCTVSGTPGTWVVL